MCAALWTAQLGECAENAVLSIPAVLPAHPLSHSLSLSLEASDGDPRKIERAVFGRKYQPRYERASSEWAKNFSHGN